MTGAGVVVSGPFEMTDIDVEIGDYRFNIEIRPRAMPSWVPPPVGVNSEKPFEPTDVDWGEGRGVLRQVDAGSPDMIRNRRREKLQDILLKHDINPEDR